MGDGKKQKRSGFDRKDIQLRVCVTSGERDALQAAADRAHLPLTTWLRSVGLKAADESDPRHQTQDGKMKYRKTKGTTTWHWSKQCSNWPDTNYDVSWAKPIAGEPCEECKQKEPAGAFEN